MLFCYSKQKTITVWNLLAITQFLYACKTFNLLIIQIHLYFCFASFLLFEKLRMKWEDYWITTIYNVSFGVICTNFQKNLFINSWTWIAFHIFEDTKKTLMKFVENVLFYKAEKTSVALWHWPENGRQLPMMIHVQYVF